VRRKLSDLCHKSREGRGPITIYLRLFVVLDIMTHSVLVREKRFVCNKDDKREDLSQKRQVIIFVLYCERTFVDCPVVKQVIRLVSVQEEIPLS